MFLSYAVREFVNELAASAASLDCVKFQATIKTAASLASRRPKDQIPGERSVLRPLLSACRAVVWALRWLLIVHGDRGVGEAAPAADFFMA